MKKISIKIITITLLLGVTGLLTYKQFKKPAKKTYFDEISAQFQDANMNVRDFYMNRFDQKQQKLDQELSSVIDLDKCKEDQNRICQNFKEYAFETYKGNNRKNITKATQQLIDHVAQDFQINTDEFIILTDERDIPATMWGCVLYVNEDLLTSYSTKAQQYVVAHEFGHLIYDDGAFITALQNQLNVDDNEHNRNLFDSLSRFHEARADIFAGTKNLAYAEGGIEFFNDLYQRYGDPLAISHPQTLDRIEANKTIVALHNQTLATA